jgi:hypothetical protein
LLARRARSLRRSVWDPETFAPGIVLAVICWARASGGVTRQGVVLTDLQSLPDCQ